MPRRSIWRIATVVALFALQLPLCALACLESQAAAQTATHQSEHPCHEETPNSPPPEEAPSPHDGCDCEVAASHVPLPASSTSWNSLALVVLTTSGPAISAPPAVYPASSVRVAGDLPPPDILLLKSSLLI